MTLSWFVHGEAASEPVARLARGGSLFPELKFRRVGLVFCGVPGCLAGRFRVKFLVIRQPLIDARTTQGRLRSDFRRVMITAPLDGAGQYSLRSPARKHLGLSNLGVGRRTGGPD